MVNESKQVDFRSVCHIATPISNASVLALPDPSTMIYRTSVWGLRAGSCNFFKSFPVEAVIFHL